MNHNWLKPALARSILVAAAVYFLSAGCLFACGDFLLTPKAVAQNARQLAWAAFGAINLFFGVLLLGFAYEWRGGAFDWVRAVGGMRQRPPPAAAGGAAHGKKVPTPIA